MHTLYPGRYLTSVQTCYEDVFLFNPYVVPTSGRAIELDYLEEVARRDVEPIRYSTVYCRALERALGVPVPPTTNRPKLYLQPNELKPLDLPERYVVINAGHKADIPLKQWRLDYWQELIESIPLPVVQIGSPSDYHKPLAGAINLIGRTNLRQLFAVVRGSLAGIGNATALNHICGAFSKPYITILGGRENPTWASCYPDQTTLHTIGALPCCATGGCWRTTDCQFNSRCMDLIKPQEIVSVLAKYL